MPITVTTDLPAPSGISVTSRTSNSVSISWTDNSSNEDDYEVYWQEVGGSWQSTSVGANTTTHQLSGLNQDTEYEIYVKAETEHTSSNSSTITPRTYLEEARSASTFVSTLSAGSELTSLSVTALPSSHSNPLTSTSIGVIDVSYAASSHTNTKTVESSRGGIDFPRSNSSHSLSVTVSLEALISLYQTVSSHSAAKSASSSRSNAYYVPRNTDSHVSDITSGSDTLVDFEYGVSSHTKPVSSFTYNERTSLELINHQLYWDDGEAAWYTNWFKEWKVLGTEDLLGLRGLVTPDAKDPAARVIVQYDETGNGNIDAESEPLGTGHDEQVMDVVGIPVDPNGWYRLKITEYSGYNSLYDIDFGIINE
jgi:hypothetical protein